MAPVIADGIIQLDDGWPVAVGGALTQPGDLIDVDDRTHVARYSDVRCNSRACGLNAIDLGGHKGASPTSQARQSCVSGQTALAFMQRCDVPVPHPLFQD